MAILAGTVITSLLQGEVKEVVLNPYEAVQWSAVTLHKGNLHTHTNRSSDGSLTPDEVIDAYLKKGYSFLALTDHNGYTWPWQNWDREPERLGMVDIQGNELSVHNHMNSLFCEFPERTTDTEYTLRTVKERGGLTQINHPGRYSQPISWYEDIYRRYDNVFAMEVFNKGDRYSGDRSKWDSLLTLTMPERPVWATSNDDSHGYGDIGRNWQVILAPVEKLNHSLVRGALIKGEFYACYDASGNAEYIPSFDSVKVVDGAIRIYTISAEKDIHWISEGREVATGTTLPLDGSVELGSYVRIALHGENGSRVLLQPFGLSSSGEVPVVSKKQIPELGVSLKSTGDKSVEVHADQHSPITVRLYDFRGRLVADGVASKQSPFLIDGLAMKPYIVQVTAAERIVTKRVLF